MNRGEIRAALISSLREESSPVGFTEAELNAYIDDTYSEVAVRTRAVTDDRTLSCPQDQQIIELPTDTVEVLGLIDDDTDQQIDHVDWVFINDRDTTFARKSSERPYFAAGWGLGHMLIYPAYDRNATMTATLAVDPGPLANDAAVPRIPPEMHVGLVRGAHHRALLKDADARRLRAAMEQLRKFEEIVGDVDLWTNKRMDRIKLALAMHRLRKPSEAAF
ncbi:MAG TPA: hypothetical protein VFB99_24000 [Vicinamibacterales bacterium]|nr:hypothetical protein [Vicinamibacterales bacterium]